MGRHTIEICNQASINEFGDDVILEEALAVIERHKLNAAPSKKDEYSYKPWSERQHFIERIALVLGVEQRPDLPPESTAARIKSMDELRALIAIQK